MIGRSLGNYDSRVGLGVREKRRKTNVPMEIIGVINGSPRSD